MLWLQTLDLEVFRAINNGSANPVFDVLMPFLSGNAFFIPGAILLGALLIWKTKVRGLVFLVALLLALTIGDGVIAKNLKSAIGRPRPFVVLEEVRRPGANPQPSAQPSETSPVPAIEAPPRKAGSASMPSSHASNWFCTLVIAGVFFRRSLWITIPLALLVSYSRIYLGVHYPSDVIVGAILGGGGAVAVLYGLSLLWRWVGAKWFPLWWSRMPNLLDPVVQPLPEEEEPEFAPRNKTARDSIQPRHELLDAQWLRLGYVLIVGLLVARCFYIQAAVIQLTGDEAYQWLWSKHLALSYFSKPPMIAYTQFLGTSLWGDSELGVRFFSPVITAVLSFLLLRFFARHVNARAGFFLVLILTATILPAVGAVLMTIDPLSVLFWTAAMLAGWKAIQADGTTKNWLWVGLWMGLGFLSKYTELFQILCWAVLFTLWKPARVHLRRPGPWLALLVNLVLALPVLIWNAQHDWITVSHVGDNAGLQHAWKPTLRFLGDFLGSELGLLNPVFFIGTAWAAIAFWRRSRYDARLVYFFSMGAPLFLVYTLYSLRSRILPNWIAPSIAPLFCLMVIYWDTQWRLGRVNLRGWLTTGLTVGLAVVVLAHDTDNFERVTGLHWPPKLDPLRRARKWDETAAVVGQVRDELLAEGKPVFLIGNHYSSVSLVTFYLPAAREALNTRPLVYFRTTSAPQNQFFFWEGYTNRVGENAVFYHELDRDEPKLRPPPAILETQFESVTDLGVRMIYYRGKAVRPLQFFACRGLK
jgi:membrane-associated phospholipid phosphatase